MEAFSRNVPSSVAKIITDPTAMPLRCLKMPEKAIREYLSRELIRCASQMNVTGNLQEHQISFCIDSILDLYSGESLEDITLCLRRGAMGYYGPTYNRFDMATISEWMREYIEEKAGLLEAEAAKGKDEEEAAEVDYEKFKQRLEQERAKEQNSAKSETKRKQAEAIAMLEQRPGQVTSVEDLRKKELHNRWIRENYDTLTGKQRKDWVSESEWMKKQK